MYRFKVSLFLSFALYILLHFPSQGPQIRMSFIATVTLT